jgi:hypothetical protein
MWNIAGFPILLLIIAAQGVPLPIFQPNQPGVLFSYH